MFEVEGGEVIVIVIFNIEYVVEKLVEGDWLQVVEVLVICVLVLKNYFYYVVVNFLYEVCIVILIFIVYKDSLLQEILILIQKKKVLELLDVEVEGDVKLIFILVVVSELQLGYGIEYIYDGKFDEKYYYLFWGQEVYFLVILEYEFDGIWDLDYIFYYLCSGNGNFGKLKIYIVLVEMFEYQL